MEEAEGIGGKGEMGRVGRREFKGEMGMRRREGGDRKGQVVDER